MTHVDSTRAAASGRSRSLLFVSQNFSPEPDCISELFSGIARGLAARGFQVSAIAGQPTYFGAAQLPTVIRDGGMEVRRVWSTQFSRHYAVGRVMNSATFALSALWRMLRRGQGKITIAVTSPPILPWNCFVARKLSGARYIILVYDVFPDAAVELAALARDGWIAWIWSRINRLVYESAERIVVVGRDTRELLEQNLSAAAAARIVWIGNWAPGDKIFPRDRAGHPVIEELSATNRFIVLYSGNIGRAHEIDTILDAAAALEADGGFLFLFYGEGHQLEKVQQLQRASQTGSVRSMPWQQRERLGLTLTGCDVALVTLKDQLSGLAVPSKLYGVLAAGKPIVVVGPTDCEAARAVRETQCGDVVLPGDVKGLIDTLLRLRSNPQRLATLGTNARRAFAAEYEFSIILEKWDSLLRDVARSL